jgi:hypothetical protein
MLFLLIVGKKKLRSFFFSQRHEFVRNFVNVGEFLQSLKCGYTQRKQVNLINRISSLLGRKIR